MAKPTRNAIYDALWTLFTGTTPPSSVTGLQADGTTPNAWGTAEQRIRMWDDVATASQPAMFHLCGPQSRAQGERGVGVTRMRSQFWFYWRNSEAYDPTNPPRKTVMDLIDWVENTISIPVGSSGPLMTMPGLPSKQTLGGLVENCYIDGTMPFDEGIAPDLQGILVVPITILCGR